MNSAPIVCLLPVRNAGAGLQTWLDDADRFADAVVALDDGSTDDTLAVLSRHPIVTQVLTNEPRDGFLGWHDGRNRNRLLAAASELAPAWIFSLDADERLDDDDAVALRRLVTTEALTPCAYGFPVFRMVAEDVYDPAYQWVFRLFCYADGQRFPYRRFDFTPVPTTIPRERWIGTTIRIKHDGDVDDADRRRRVEKYREADPEGLFKGYYEHLPPLSTGPFRRWRARDPITPLLHVAEQPASAPVEGGRPHVVCLLPARDCADLLPGWFESVARVADAVVALDDGSVDDTATILRAHPLVARVLTNPVRPGYANWDDGTNRNRLLAAAAELRPDWIISIDADERIPLEDGVALRRFLREEAQPGFGYALRSYRMIGDEDHYDRLDYDAYRLFAFEPGQVFPTARLHAPPIPTAIPPVQWRQTTIRMKHLVSLTETDRRARWDKFGQADPDREWEPDYAYTIEPPGPLKVWEPRPLDLPFLVQYGTTPSPTDELDLDGPVLTVVVTVDPGEEHDALSMLEELAGEDGGRVELLAATRDGYAAGVLRGDERITVVDVEPELTDAGLRNAALHAARGDYVMFLFVGDRVLRGGIQELLDAHEGGHGVVGVRVADATTTPAGWAGLLLHGAAPDEAYASFVREPLLWAGGFEDDAPGGLEVAAARLLLGRGFTATTVPSVVRCRRTRPSVACLLQERYEVGRRGAAGESSQAVAAWRQLDALDGALDAPRPVVAGLIAAGAAATWLGGVRNRLRVIESEPEAEK